MRLMGDRWSFQAGKKVEDLYHMKAAEIKKLDLSLADSASVVAAGPQSCPGGSCSFSVPGFDLGRP